MYATALQDTFFTAQRPKIYRWAIIIDMFNLITMCLFVTGPLETKIGKGHVSMNLTLRK